MTVKLYNYLYKITNTFNNKIYIGIHSTDNINDGYMGSGHYLKRAQNKYGINNFSKDILSHYNSRTELEDAETLAVTKEFTLREDTYNLNVGGGNGFHHASTKKLISEKRIEYLKTAKPFKHSKEWRKKLTEHNPGGVAVSLPIYQICTITGSIIKEWKSAGEAERLGGFSRGNIRDSIYKEFWIHNGFYWRGINSSDIINGKLHNIEELNKYRNRPVAGFSITSYDINGTQLMKFESILQAARHYNLCGRKIGKCVKNSTEIDGLYFKRL